jgi:hypothetical protein
MSAIQERIIEVLGAHQSLFDRFTQRTVCICDGWQDTDHGDNGHYTHQSHLAAAIQDVLEIWLPPLFASALHGYADSELSGFPGYGDDPNGTDVLEQLNRDAASIASYALTSNKWRTK